MWINIELWSLLCFRATRVWWSALHPICIKMWIV